MKEGLEEVQKKYNVLYEGTGWRIDLFKKWYQKWMDMK